MASELKLPETTRAKLREFYLAAEQARKDFQSPLLVALDFLGLDPSLQHGINFDTGMVTPAEAPAKPTPIRDEAAS